MARFIVEPRGPFSLDAAARFLEGFAATAQDAAPRAGHLHLAFVPDGETAAAGACVRAHNGAVVIETVGAARDARTRRQVERVLSLDVDATGFPAIGERDPVVARLQRRYAGLRPVNFLSPFEAGVWLLIGHRIRMSQAAAIKARMGEELGEAIEIDGEGLRAFPPPEVVAALEGFRGLPQRKLDNLRALAHAALEGRLDAERLRAKPAEEAVEELLDLPGVGRFTAEGIVLRGAGAPDLLATSEPRIAPAVQLAYGLAEPPSADDVRALGERWRPFRSWVQVLLRVALDDERRAPGSWARGD